MRRSLIIIPTYNEADNITNIIDAIFTVGHDFDILVVDDSSPHKTGDKVANYQEKYANKLFLSVRKKKEGLGPAYLHGFKWALQRDYSYIFQMDADFSHNPEELPKMVAVLNSGRTDVVVGSRYLTGINVVNWSLRRVLLSYFASRYVRCITQLPVKDPTSGFVGYKRETLEQLNLKKIYFRGYAFQIEMKYKIWRKQNTLQEHPIIFINRFKGESKMTGGIISEALLGVIYLRWLARDF